MLEGLPEGTTYAELLEYLKRDLRLDASTDVLASTVTQENLSTGNRGMLAEAFLVYDSAGYGITTLTPFTWNTVVLNSSNRLTNNNGRFTPKVPGYYFFGGTCYTTVAFAATDVITAELWRNGAAVQPGSTAIGPIAAGNGATTLVAFAKANGSTDYFEYVMQVQGVAQTLAAGQINNFWFGHLIGKT